MKDKMKNNKRVESVQDHVFVIWDVQKTDCLLYTWQTHGNHVSYICRRWELLVFAIISSCHIDSCPLGYSSHAKPNKVILDQPASILLT